MSAAATTGPLALDDALAAAERDPSNAFVTTTPDAARRVDRSGVGPLTGLRLGIKDNYCWAGVRTTCASRVLDTHIAPYTATVVERALAAGAVPIGKCNMDEFACGSTGAHSAWGPTDNPAAPGRVPGGSSSGCGAALAAGVVDVALGSDTGGSVRAPAAWCGVVALKPTNGSVSRWGLLDLAMSLDTPGAMARDVAGLARLHDAIAGPDPRDALTGPTPTAVSPAAAHADPDGLRVGAPRRLPDGVDPEVAAAFAGALRAMEHAGARLVPVDLPDPALSLAAYYVVNAAEFASAMHKFDGTTFGVRGPTVEATRALLGPEARRRILLGTLVTTREHQDAWYRRAVAARSRIRASYDVLFAGLDVLATPTMPTPPPRHGELSDPLVEYAADVFTVPANLAGIPAGSVPLSPTSRGPIGLQFLAPRWADAAVVRAMACWEAIR